LPRLCKYIVIKNDSELHMKNEIIRITPDLNLNFWTGVGKAEIKISEFNEKNERSIEYRFYLTRAFIGLFFFIGFLLISVIFVNNELNSKILVLTIFGSSIVILGLIFISIIILRHKMAFYGVIRRIKADFIAHHHT